MLYMSKASCLHENDCKNLRIRLIIKKGQILRIDEFYIFI